MDHAEALAIHATERYVLGELSTSDAAAFEEHFFECVDCAADLESATVLVANARTVFRMDTELGRSTAVPRARSWRSAWNAFLTGSRWRFATAAAALAGLTLGVLWTYQTFVTIPRLKEAAVAAETAFALPSFALAGTSRAEEPTISIGPNTPSFAIYFDIDEQGGYPEYRCVLRDSAGTARFTLRVAAPPAGEPMTLSLPAHKLQAGRYELVVNGVREGREKPGIAVYRFNLEIK